MPLFVCSNPECDAIENTATSHYWSHRYDPKDNRDPICSACDPDTNQWHDRFPRTKATLEYLRQHRQHFYWLPQRWRERLSEQGDVRNGA